MLCWTPFSYIDYLGYKVSELLLFSCEREKDGGGVGALNLPSGPLRCKPCRHTYQVICFCSFDLSCLILEKYIFIENLYFVLFY